MKKVDRTAKRKLNLNREIIVPLQPESLDKVLGGLSDIRTCIYDSCKTKV